MCAVYFALVSQAILGAPMMAHCHPPPAMGLPVVSSVETIRKASIAVFVPADLFRFRPLMNQLPYGAWCARRNRMVTKASLTGY
ncbi:hypothetical protein [Mucilaginibacter pineti]|uniref:hypothetical protein n=1 Tax=Mucilaginibacter pineti TaxID=1391627 RepID=UPI000B85E607|nr:hypothetical protein [Mucilaginibacter pineti]